MTADLGLIGKEIGKQLLGKPEQINQALCCLLAGGHLLIEDLPGMGKTSLAKAMAQVLGLGYQRVQFTSDLMPADLLGVSVYQANSGEFEFRQGPVFTQLLLADELNRATPKTQGALLEAMAERQVSIDGKTLSLDAAFFVIATQNPQSQSGTYPLPESQLDRFLMRISLGYPDPRDEARILSGQALPELAALLDAETILTLQQQVAAIELSQVVLAYVQRLVAYTREYSGFDVGLSTRGALALVAASKAWAYLAGRNYVIPDDVQAVLLPVCLHRVSYDQSLQAQQGLEKMLVQVEVVA